MALATPATRLIVLESPGSLTFEMQDVPAIARLARARGVLTLMDNTWAAGLLFKPLAHGVDLSVQALTKYVGGHSDVFMGSVGGRLAGDGAGAGAGDRRLRLVGLAATTPTRCCAACAPCRPGWSATAPRRLKVAGLAARAAARSRRCCTLPCPARPATTSGSATTAGAAGVFSIVLQPAPERRGRGLPRRA